MSQMDQLQAGNNVPTPHLFSPSQLKDLFAAGALFTLAKATLHNP
jgi:hypothetical protein